jgi:hypothetical protein
MKHREYCKVQSEYKLRLLYDYFHGVLNDAVSTVDVMYLQGDWVIDYLAVN